MATAAISPKGAYFAKSCPERVQLDVLQPCEPLPDPPFLQKLFRAGDAARGRDDRRGLRRGGGGRRHRGRRPRRTGVAHPAGDRPGRPAGCGRAAAGGCRRASSRRARPAGDVRPGVPAGRREVAQVSGAVAAGPDRRRVRLGVRGCVAVLRDAPGSTSISWRAGTSGTCCSWRTTAGCWSRPVGRRRASGATSAASAGPRASSSGTTSMRRYWSRRNTSRWPRCRVGSARWSATTSSSRCG